MCLGLLLLVATPARSQEACSGPYKGRRVSPEELADVLAAHQKWLGKESGGRQANLWGANLHRASLHGADLQWANLQEADLTEADLYDADVFAVIFEPRALPNVQRLAFARHLVDLRFTTAPQALQTLQGALKTAGLRQQERAVTYAIRHTRRCQVWSVFCAPDMAATPEFFKKIYGASQLLAFEWPCAYGMVPGRALGILVGLLLGGAGLHMLALSARGRTGM
jgi:hypothetical protein